MAEMKDICSVSGPLSQRIPSTLLVAALHKMPFDSNFMCSDALPLRPPGLGAFSEIATPHVRAMPDSDFTISIRCSSHHVANNEKQS